MKQRLTELVDWTRPWLIPLLPAAEAVRHVIDWRSGLNTAAAKAGLCTHRGLPIRFVPQENLPPSAGYEAFISATGNVPTRENLHDLFNALVWLTFPEIKAQLNAVQASEIERSAAVSASRVHGRGSVRDAATIFDENAAVLVTSSPGMIEALREHRWTEALVRHRDEFLRHGEVWLFGHALIEKLVQPYKAITAHAWPVLAGSDYFLLTAEQRRAWVDREVAGQLADGLTTSDFMHLPVLGIPGWSEGQDRDFYADASVFRPKRRAKSDSAQPRPDQPGLA